MKLAVVKLHGEGSELKARCLDIEASNRGVRIVHTNPVDHGQIRARIGRAFSANIVAEALQRPPVYRRASWIQGYYQTIPTVPYVAREVREGAEKKTYVVRISVVAAESIQCPLFSDKRARRARRLD